MVYLTQRIKKIPRAYAVNFTMGFWSPSKPGGLDQLEIRSPNRVELQRRRSSSEVYSQVEDMFVFLVRCNPCTGYLQV